MISAVEQMGATVARASLETKSCRGHSLIPSFHGQFPCFFAAAPEGFAPQLEKQSLISEVRGRIRIGKDT